MKYYKTPAGVSAIESDGSQDALIQANWVIMSPVEVEEHRKPRATAVEIVTMRQCQLALLAAGLLDQVDALIAAQARAVRVAWATAGTVERNNPLIASLAEALGLSEARVDELFEQAALL